MIPYTTATLYRSLPPSLTPAIGIEIVPQNVPLGYVTSHVYPITLIDSHHTCAHTSHTQTHPGIVFNLED